MTERAINIQQRRMSQFLPALQPVLSYDELVREKLESGKFPLTKTAWIKMFGMLLLLGGLALFLGQSMCLDGPKWYRYFFPICLGLNLIVELIFYIIFSGGFTAKKPGKFVAADILLNLSFSILSIGAAVVTILQCGSDAAMHGVPGPIGIAGAAISIVGCGSIFLMYRYVEEEFQEPPQTPLAPPQPADPRKSIHA